MRVRTATQAQFELMLSFMEKHGDMIPNSNDGSAQTRLESLQHWIQLVDLLNDKSVGEPKPIEKWRKCWSDLKNNTKRKAQRLQTKDGASMAELTDLERRVLRLLAKSSRRNRTESDNDIDPTTIKVEMEPKYRRPLPDPCFYEDNEDAPRRRKQSTCSEASTSSSCPQPAIKRRKPNVTETSSIDDITQRYLEFEKEREKMAHEREMARIRQNDHFYSILSRFVKVMENLAPCIQKYVEQKCNE